ncbi:hypothetical protein GUITHDRAFT_144573 [Guillardia theta CCMP2712]|uniref:Uncharacterized protein n=1 Tax=Guillardia theta (strain CCMP2712) TaxID=905079 RepID=L1IQC2_GUITC|nr:hypothetical protein GUITHDRAFT_144573 [Guillardia theta CCMP2712]EKX38084.1 hypothetical protein GUITHDRAFT_144573 [Guillardia theta CCMP2712]|eukprot:XP_005825064.1 hypothetical protein GUITHDRAFT_144573 [Guillardia theta CCMP2712]
MARNPLLASLLLLMLHTSSPFMSPLSARMMWKTGSACRRAMLLLMEPPRRVQGGGGFPITPLQDWNEIERRVPLGTCSAGNTEQGTSDWVLLTDKRSTLREIFDVELRSTLGAVEVEWGVWSLKARPGQDELRSLACSRALVRVLVGPCRDADEICEAVGDSSLCLGDTTSWTMHHERISDCQHAGAKVRTSEIVCSLARKIKGGEALPHSNVHLRFILLECASGLSLGLGYWSRQDESFLDFRGSKPFTFNAALEPDVATAVINVLRSRCRVQAAAGGWGVVNACSGSGTLLFAALKGGASWVLGVDKNLRCVEGAIENLEYFGYQTSLLDQENVEERVRAVKDGGEAFLIHGDLEGLGEKEAMIGKILHEKGNTIGIVADLPFGKNLVTHEEALRAIVRGVRRIAGEQVVCLISGDDISALILDNDFDIIEQARSFNGKHYVLYMTFALARCGSSVEDTS